MYIVTEGYWSSSSSWNSRGSSVSSTSDTRPYCQPSS